MALAMLLAPAAASAFTTNGVAATPIATGFPSSASGAGPLGLAIDHSSRLFAIDGEDGWLYRFGAGGGVAGPGTQLGPQPIGNKPTGLAFTSNGRLYAARIETGEVVELNPTTGAVVRTVATGVPCPAGLAADPVSGDLFVTLMCGGFLARIADLTSANPRFEHFSDGIGQADGITTAADGTVFLVDGTQIKSVTGTGAPVPGLQQVIADVPNADGLATGGKNGKLTLLVNRTDGNITQIDFDQAGPHYTDVLTGGSRGDFAAVGPDGCFYATQTDSILRVTEPDGSCDKLAGGLTTPPSDSSGNPLGLPSTSRCLDRRKFTFHLHHAKRSRVVGVDVFVNGARVVHKRARSITTVTLKRLPEKKFRVRIVALHSSGSSLESTRVYRGCKKSKPRTHRHGHKPK